MSAPIPLSMPDELLDAVREVSRETHLSQQDVMRQSIKLGLPKLRSELGTAGGRVTNVDPLSNAVLTRLYKERDEDMASIRKFIALQPKDAE